MLILTRKWGERIFIGDDIIVEVVEIARGKVRLGFSAPPGVKIHREELKLRIAEEGETRGSEGV